MPTRTLAKMPTQTYAEYIAELPVLGMGNLTEWGWWPQMLPPGTIDRIYREGVNLEALAQQTGGRYGRREQSDA